MTSRTSLIPACLMISAAALLLAGCASPAADTGTGTGGSGTSDSGDSAGGGSSEKCPVVPGYEYFSDSSITTAPEPGQDFGDGTPITFTGPTEVVPLYSLYYVDDKGKVFPNSESAFDPTAPGGTYTTDLNVFGDEANNRPGILELETIYYDGLVLDNPDPSYVAGTSTVILGRYCLTLKVG